MGREGDRGPWRRGEGLRFIARSVWTPEAIDKIADHDLTMADVEEALDTAVGEDLSRSTGRPMRFGYALDGRFVAVVFEWLGKSEILIVTAFEAPEP
jgi:uncharacterized DUF497 family protein